MEFQTAMMKQAGWEKIWDEVVRLAVFGSVEEKGWARAKIWEVGQEVGVRPASINNYYMAQGRGELVVDSTVPAINIRGMAYEMARAVLGKAKEMKVGALIVEIARSEMGYCDQTPEEYASVVIGAAIREGWRGPLFIQGDHFQTKESSPGVPKEGEVESIKKLITEAMEAGFYNIDIDTSTLVDLSKKGEKEQQKANIQYTVELLKHIRENSPDKVVISVGGEIGHIGGKNSTVAECEAYVDGVRAGSERGMIGLSKISAQTGTSHGGVVLPDGTLAEVAVDFEVLEKISEVLRTKYQMGGVVQHGASTLKEEYFALFPERKTLEIHLATGFQNMIMDHPAFPKELLNKMYRWLDDNKQGERKEGQTDEQFHYELRKKAWGHFKRECWEVGEEERAEIRETIAKQCEFLFKQLRVEDTKELVEKYVVAPKIQKTMRANKEVKIEGEVEGLSD